MNAACFRLAFLRGANGAMGAQISLRRNVLDTRYIVACKHVALSRSQMRMHAPPPSSLFVTGTAFSAVLGRSLSLRSFSCCGQAIRVKRCKRELSVRRALPNHLTSPPKKALKDAGAAPALIEAIKGGSYVSSSARRGSA
jgi:hypothetical protein